MRVRFLGLWLPLWCACSGTNVVAGPDQTEAERIEASLPAWCANLCNETRMCAQSGCVCDGEVCDCGVEDHCESNCREVITAMLRTSEACAASAGRLQSCYEASGCEVFGDSGRCKAVEAEASDCYSGPSPESTGEDGGAVGAVDVPGQGSAGSPGSAPGCGDGQLQGSELCDDGNQLSYDGCAADCSMVESDFVCPLPGSACHRVPSLAPSNSSLVSCTGAYFGSFAVSEPDVPGITCKDERTECSDGREYSMVCILTPDDERACVCLSEGTSTTFVPQGSCPQAEMSAACGCPTQAEMNAGCGWQLAEL